MRFFSAASVLCASVFSGCGFWTPLPDDVDILCSTDADCPAGLSCAEGVGRCLDPNTIERVPPGLAEDPEVMPAVATVDTELVLRFVPDEALGRPPDVMFGEVKAGLDDVVPDEDGAYTARYRVRGTEEEGPGLAVIEMVDAFDNFGDVSVGYRLDFTPPVPATSNVSAPAVGNGVELIVQVTFDEVLAGLPTLRLLDEGGGTTLALTAADAGNGYTFAHTFVQGTDPAGGFGLAVSAIDGAGNEGVTPIGSLAVDYDAPTVESVGISPSANIGLDDYVEVSVVFSEGLASAPVLEGSGVEFGGALSFDVVDGQSGGSAWTFRHVASVGDEDSYDLLLSAIVDEAGNIAPDESVGQVVIDATAPEVTLVFYNGDGVDFAAADTLELTIRVDEPLLQDPVVRAGTLPIPLTAVAGLEYSYIFPLLGSGLLGASQLSAQVIDLAGNSDTALLGTVNVDALAPTVLADFVLIDPEADNPLGAGVRAMLDGSELIVIVTADENIVGAQSTATLVCDDGTGNGPEIALTCVANANQYECTYVLEATVQPANLTCAVAVVLTDEQGNTSAQPTLLEEPVIIDRTPPVANDALLDLSLVKSLHIPHGARQNNGDPAGYIVPASWLPANGIPATTDLIEAAAFQPTTPDEVIAQVLFFDDVDGVVVGRSSCTALGCASEMLDDGRAPVRVWFRLVDHAGNLSEPYPIPLVEAVVTMGSKSAEGVVTNPHQLRTVANLGPSRSVPFGTPADRTVVESLDGLSTDVTTVPVARSTKGSETGLVGARPYLTTDPFSVRVLMGRSGELWQRRGHWSYLSDSALSNGAGGQFAAAPDYSGSYVRIISPSTPFCQGPTPEDCFYFWQTAISDERGESSSFLLSLSDTVSQVFNGYTMVEHRALRRIFLLGGQHEAYGAFGEVSQISGGSWIDRSHPLLPYSYIGAAYDAVNDEIVAFGGTTQDRCNATTTEVFDDTHRYDGGWSRPALTPRPAPRCGMAMAFDEASRNIVMYGGVDGSGANLGDTWLYHTTLRSYVAVTLTDPEGDGQPPAGQGKLAYDWLLGRAILVIDGQTWSFASTTNSWRREEGIAEANAAHLLGGVGPNDLRMGLAELPDGSVLVSASAASLLQTTYTSLAMAFTRSAGFDVMSVAVPPVLNGREWLLGRLDALNQGPALYFAPSAVTSDHLAYDGSALTTLPSDYVGTGDYLFGSSAAYVDDIDAMVLFTGATDEGPQGETFLLTSAGDTVTYRPGPPVPEDVGPSRMAATYDAGRGMVIVFGGTAQDPSAIDPLNVGTTWAYDPFNEVWTEVVGTNCVQPPGPRADVTLWYDPVSRQTFLHGGRTNLTEFLDDTYVLDDDDCWRVVKTGVLSQETLPDSAGSAALAHSDGSTLFALGHSSDEERGRVFVLNNPPGFVPGHVMDINLPALYDVSTVPVIDSIEFLYAAGASTNTSSGAALRYWDGGQWRPLANNQDPAGSPDALLGSLVNPDELARARFLSTLSSSVVPAGADAVTGTVAVDYVEARLSFTYPPP